MIIRKSLVLLYALVLLQAVVAAQDEKVDLSVVYKIKQEGLKNSGIEDMIFGLTDYVGPRLAGSTGESRGNEWARKKMEELGLRNVRIEEAGKLTRGGWDNLKTYAAMTSPYYSAISCNPVAWTGSTNGLIRAEVALVEIKNEEDFQKYKGTLSGKIALMASAEDYEISFEPQASRFTDDQLKEMAMVQATAGKKPNFDFAAMSQQRTLRQRISAFLKDEGIVAVLNNAGAFNVPRSTGFNYTSGTPEPVAELNVPVESHGRMERLLQNGIPVEMELEIKNQFLPSPYVYNVIGEIPGTDKVLKNEIVMLGAHIDSWHGGTGAADNAAGCVVMLEAMRILNEIGIAPRRTIRIILWGGEEMGYLGSTAYIEKYIIDPGTKAHKPEYDRFSCYFNMDNGSGKYRGIYAQENEQVRPIFEQWLKPFADMGATTVTIRNTTGTDHTTFDKVGLPGFQFIQDRLEYRRGYHTVMDTYERIVMDDLKHNAVITASFVYNAAMRNEKLPAKPELTEGRENVAARQK